METAMTIKVDGRNVTWEEFIAKARSATDVRLYNLPGVTALPEMPAATDVWLYNLPGVTALPEMPAATDVGLDAPLQNLRRAAASKAMPAAAPNS
jgi:predicted butyrate kinase (DUF1464 family)